MHRHLAALLLLLAFAAPALTRAQSVDSLTTSSASLTQEQRAAVIAELQRLVIQLTQQLQAIIAARTGQGTTGTPGGAAACAISRTLALGMRGEDVRCLQRFLIAQSLLARDSGTGYFGPLTRAAVIALQKERGLEQVGHVGRLTRGIVNAVPQQTSSPLIGGTILPVGGGSEGGVTLSSGGGGGGGGSGGGFVPSSGGGGGDGDDVPPPVPTPIPPPEPVPSPVPTPDTLAPSISLTAPAASSIVSGTITIAATASDNVAVAGVQFKLDGKNLGTFDTAAPYSVIWDTAAGTNGAHVLTAVVWGASGGSAKSTQVQVTVANAYPAITASPAPGSYSSAQAVTLSAPGARFIRYTLDGSTPSCATGRYAGYDYGYGYTYADPVSITAARTIKATACPAEGEIVAFRYDVSVARPPVRVSIDWNATSQDISPLAWGVNVPPTMGGRDNAGFMNALSGMTLRKPLVRVYGWAKILPPATVGDDAWLNPDGTWNASKIIALLRQYRDAGYEVMINLPDGPRTGTGRYPDPDLVANPDRVARWFADLVRIVNVDGRLGVQYWEVLSERDNTTNAGTSLTATQMAVFLDRASRAMKAVDSTIRVGGPAAASLNTKSAYLVSMVQQLQGLGTNIDFVSAHQYGGGADPFAPMLSARYDDVQQRNAYNMLYLRRGLDRVSPSRRIPIFLSEYNASWGQLLPFNTTADGIVYDALTATGAIHAGADIAQFWAVSNVDDYPTLIRGGQALPASNYLMLLNRYFHGKEVIAHTSNAGLVSVFAAKDASGPVQTYALMLINRSEWSETVSLDYASIVPTQLNKFMISDAGYSGPETISWPLQQDLTMPPHSIVVLVADSAHSNRAPIITAVNGPATTTIGIPGTWTVVASDPDGDPVSFRLYWGDRMNWPSPPATSAPTPNTVFHYTYTRAGIFTIGAVAYDTHGASSTRTATVTVASSTP